MTDQMISMRPPDTHEPDEPLVEHTADEPEPDELVVRRNGWLSLLISLLSALVSAAYCARAATTDGGLDWLLCLVLAVITWVFVYSFLDSRTPLLVADSHGVRIRLGRTWRGMAWSDLQRVEHLPRRGLLHDGRLVIFPRALDEELATLGASGRRHAKLNGLLLGSPFALPLGLTTRVMRRQRKVTSTLTTLASGRCEVVEVVIVVASEPEEEPIAELVAELVDAPMNADSDPTPQIDDTDKETDKDTDKDSQEDSQEDSHEDTHEVPRLTASPTPAQFRAPVSAVRADLVDDGADDVHALQDTAPHQPFGDTAPVPAIASATSTFVIGDLADLPVIDPVVGPVLAAARTQLRLSVEQLAERTRIRPHIIEAIEIDDFAACGGDFYARGHLRTLARVLGVDVTPLLATYDDRYADAPIDPRRVFEAELATGRHGPIRSVHGAPNWSVVVAAVMMVVLAWSIARLVTDSPTGPAAPSLSQGSAGLTSGTTSIAAPVPVTMNAAGSGARVVIRDGNGKVVFTGDLAFGQSRTVQVAPPVRIQSSEGSLEVSVNGVSKGKLGKTGHPAQDVFTAS